MTEDYRRSIRGFTDDEPWEMAAAEQERQEQHERGLAAFGGSDAALSVYEATIAKMLAAADSDDEGQ
jgi:hypothetical protein